MKMAEKPMRWVTLVFAVLAIGLLLAGNTSAATIEKEIVVKQDELCSTEFMVEEAGLIYAELDLEGANGEIELMLKSPSGEVKGEVWGNILRYEVSEDEVEEGLEYEATKGTEWEILVRSGLYDDAYGTLKITYPSDTTPPTITITCSPENPTTDQQITFVVTASDKCKIEIWVNAEKVKECLGTGSCTYIGGPYLDYAGMSVAYGANAYDETGNRAWTGYKVVQISEAGDIDMTPSTVTGNSPTGENVPVATEITIIFSEQMNKESVEDAFYIDDSMQNRVSGTFSWDGDTMIFTPSLNLDYDTQYFISLFDDAHDLAYNSLYYEWNFKTRLPNNPPNTPNPPSGPSTGYAGTSYSYSSFTKDPDGDQIRYIFDWGDGTVSETEFVGSGRSVSQSHVWEGEGEYSVRAMAADSEGGESGWSPPLVVAISERTHPTAVISANPTVITEGETVSFGAGASKPGDPDSEIVSYDWDFGDESIGAGVNVDHTYARSGRYTATLTVTDNNNLSATASVGITVETTSDLFVSIFTGSVSSGESGEVLVRVTSNGDPVQDASVHLSATTGSLNPNEGVTGRDGEFASIFTAPIVDATERYTIYAEAEMEGLVGRGSESDMITVEPDIPPTAHIEIYQDPAEEGGSITIEGWGEDEDGDVLGCRWTFPDGTTIPESGDSSELTLEPDEVQAGVYRFAVRDDQGVWSEVAEFELPMPPQDEREEEITPMQTDFSRMVEYISEDPVALAAVAALAAGTLLMLRGRNGRGITKGSKGGGNSEEKGEKGEKDEKPRYGSIHATSTPDDAVVLLDGLDLRGRSPVTISKVPVGLHFLLFVKSDHFGYERKILVTADQTVNVHCDLTKVPEITLKLSADPTEIMADGKSKSTITIEIEDKKGRPIPVPKEIAVVVETNIGEMDSPARIPAGKASTTSVLTSSGAGGTATVKAALEVEGVLKLEGNTTVEFVDAEVAT